MRGLWLVLWWVVLGGCAAPEAPPRAVDPGAVARYGVIVHVLADPAMEGRGLETSGVERARDWLVDAFAGRGLEPAFDDGYVHRLAVPWISEGRKRAVENVGALLPGRGALARELVIVSAHYDHLGVIDGQVHPGADDNASGVAAMLLAAEELATVLDTATARRTVAFLAFSGEESGQLGSRGLVADPDALAGAALRPVAMVNLDMVGRLGGGRLEVHGVSTSGNWPGVLRRAASEVGLRLRLLDAATGRSDHQPFADRGVPAVLLHTGLHGDYHLPTDRPEKIDDVGGAWIAGFLARLVADLATDPARNAGL